MGIHLTSPAWWANQFITVFIVLCIIGILKKVFSKYEIPYVSELVTES